MGAAPASQSERFCRTNHSLSDKNTARYPLARVKVRRSKFLPMVSEVLRYESCGRVGSRCNITTGRRRKKARRTDWSALRRKPEARYLIGCTLHHEQNLSQSKDETQYSKPSFLHAFYKSFMESIWQAGTPLISSA